jgi:hypothetical protein
MGILHKLVFILGKLDPKNDKWRERQRQRAIRDTEVAFMFVSAGWMVTGTEALVLEDGGCTVDRRQFESLFRVFGHKKNITIEAKPGLLQIEDERIKVSDYSDHVTAPGEFKVFPVSDTGVISESKASLGRDRTG